MRMVDGDVEEREAAGVSVGRYFSEVSPAEKEEVATQPRRPGKRPERYRCI